MGASKCTQCCDRGVSEKISCNQRIAALPPQWARPNPAPCERITGLSYAPPPAKEEDEETKELLGTRLPQKPEVLATGQQRSSRSPGSSAGSKNCGRPGEPVNKVFVQFSNDLEGFLPYSLVISDETGLEFKAMSASANFRIDPLNVLKATRLDYETLARDSLFVGLSKSISARPLPADAAAGGSRQDTGTDERVKPPYEALVQLHVRRTVLEGGQVLVFIAVQSERLAMELVRSCEQLRRRRAIQYYYDCQDHERPEDSQRASIDRPRSGGSHAGSRGGSRAPSQEASRSPGSPTSEPASAAAATPVAEVESPSPSQPTPPCPEVAPELGDGSPVGSMVLNRGDTLFETADVPTG